NVWGNGLLLSGLGVAMAMWKFGVHRASAMIEAVADLHFGRAWIFCIRIFPLLFVALSGWFIVGAVTGTEQWWNPFQEISLGIIVMLALNRFLAKKVVAGPMTEGAGGASPEEDTEGPAPDDGTGGPPPAGGTSDAEGGER